MSGRGLCSRINFRRCSRRHVRHLCGRIIVMVIITCNGLVTRHSLGRICASFLALRTKTTLRRITRTPSSFPAASGFLWTMQLVLITSRWEQTSGHATTTCELEWKRFRRPHQPGIGMSIPSLKATQHPVDQLLCRGSTTSMPLRIFTVPWFNIHLTMEPFSLTFPRTLFPHLSAAITDPPN